jgi:hypothetical protein
MAPTNYRMTDNFAASSDIPSAKLGAETRRNPPVLPRRRKSAYTLAYTPGPTFAVCSRWARRFAGAGLITPLDRRQIYSWCDAASRQGTRTDITGITSPQICDEVPAAAARPMAPVKHRQNAPIGAFKQPEVASTEASSRASASRMTVPGTNPVAPGGPIRPDQDANLRLGPALAALLARVSVSKPKGCETAGRISGFRALQRLANLSLNLFATTGPAVAEGDGPPRFIPYAPYPHTAERRGRPQEEGGYWGSGQLTKAAGDVSPDVERACPAHDLPGKRAAADPDHTCNAFKHAEAPA